MTVTVGFFGKLPAHGDFVRRGLPAAIVTLLDDWLQSEFMRSADPAATIRALVPLRFASTAMAPGELAMGTLVASVDRVGRDYALLALRLSSHPSGALPEVPLAAWDDWCGRAEAVLTAARAGDWTADTTQGALETAARAATVELTVTPPFAISAEPRPATVGWRPTLGLSASSVATIDGMPRGADFDRFIASVEIG